jgi:hypothetical protein
MGFIILGPLVRRSTARILLNRKGIAASICTRLQHDGWLRAHPPTGVVALDRAQRCRRWSSPKVDDPTTQRLRFQREMAQNEERVMGSLPYASYDTRRRLGDVRRGVILLRLRRRLPAVVGSLRQGHEAWKLLGTRAVPLDLMVELGRPYFGSATAADQGKLAAGFGAQKVSPGLDFYKG